MPEEPNVTLWPTRENYPRFAAVCDDAVPKTFDEFEALAEARIAEARAEGIEFKKLSFDPDRMAQWCRAHFGKVDANTRRLYAGFIALSD